jgi:hypothetical protein
MSQNFREKKGFSLIFYLLMEGSGWITTDPGGPKTYGCRTNMNLEPMTRGQMKSKKYNFVFLLNNNWRNK